jgi:hypothetical protein
MKKADQPSAEFNSYYKQGTNMTFEIKLIDREAFDEIWTSEVAKQLDGGYIYSTENWSQDLSRRTWAIDEEKRACLIWVHMADRLNGANCYAYVMRGEFALIRNISYCTYSVVTVSAGLQSRIEEVKQMVGDALRAGGVHLDGVTDPKNVFAVPDARFVS